MALILIKSGESFIFEIICEGFFKKEKGNIMYHHRHQELHPAQKTILAWNHSFTKYHFSLKRVSDDYCWKKLSAFCVNEVTASKHLAHLISQPLSNHICK